MQLITEVAMDIHSKMSEKEGLEDAVVSNNVLKNITENGETDISYENKENIDAEGTENMPTQTSQKETDEVNGSEEAEQKESENLSDLMCKLEKNKPCAETNGVSREGNVTQNGNLLEDIIPTELCNGDDSDKNIGELEKDSVENNIEILNSTESDSETTSINKLQLDLIENNTVNSNDSVESDDVIKTTQCKDISEKECNSEQIQQHADTTEEDELMELKETENETSDLSENTSLNGEKEPEECFPTKTVDNMDIDQVDAKETEKFKEVLESTDLSDAQSLENNAAFMEVDDHPEVEGDQLKEGHKLEEVDKKTEEEADNLELEGDKQDALDEPPETNDDHAESIDDHPEEGIDKPEEVIDKLEEVIDKPEEVIDKPEKADNQLEEPVNKLQKEGDPLKEVSSSDEVIDLDSKELGKDNIESGEEAKSAKECDEKPEEVNKNDEVIDLDDNENIEDTTESSQIGSPSKMSDTTVEQPDMEEVIDLDFKESNQDQVKAVENRKAPEQCNENTNQSDEVIDLDQETSSSETENKSKEKEAKTEKKMSMLSRLSNTLDILSDDEEDEPSKSSSEHAPLKDTSPCNEKQSINIEDDDDIMLVDESEDVKEKITENVVIPEVPETITPENDAKEQNIEKNDEETYSNIKVDVETENKDTGVPDEVEVNNADVKASKIDEKVVEKEKEKVLNQSPLVQANFLKSCKKNLAEMSRDDLEEFCILKIAESIIDRSSLNEIKSNLKTLTQNVEEYKKKALLLTKQNRDLQVVLKSVQEEQKKNSDSPIAPLRITRSVGMQVYMMDKPTKRKSSTAPVPALAAATPARPQRQTQTPRPQKQTPNPAQNIPVPRLIPANNTKPPPRTTPNTPNGLKTPPTPAASQKVPEKRTRVQSQGSVTVDLTDDEPPPKIPNKTSPMPPVRMVPQQNLMQPRQNMSPTTLTSPRKVYIPIGQNQGVRGATFMLKTVPSPGPRHRAPTPQLMRMPNTLRMARAQIQRHPAPLPDAMKQYQPPNWKALPPAPDLKLSKVENGIVISWKIEGYHEDSYEEIASYQLYAYQETTAPPSTSLWKKIGDVKALPLPMACTLTQFMAGYKYYFAVRAVDIRSRLGPFSLPGSILLLNKM